MKEVYRFQTRPERLIYIHMKEEINEQPLWKTSIARPPRHPPPPAPLNVRPNKSQHNETVLLRPEASNCERVHVIATF